MLSLFDYFIIGGYSVAFIAIWFELFLWVLSITDGLPIKSKNRKPQPSKPEVEE